MKRIIGSILVVVMLALSLVGCGYSFADDNMAKYATFSDEDKAAFENALKLIIIENGDFLLDADVREEKVLDSIYAAIADAEGTEAEKMKEGKPDGRDVIYYSYYATAEFDGVTAVFYADKMKSASATKLQLRPSGDYDDDTVGQKLYELFGTYFQSHNFEEKVYASVTSGTTVEGDIAYVTYTKTLDDDSSAEPVVYTNQKVIIGAAPAADTTATSLESYLCGKSIASSIEKLQLQEDGKNYTYSNIKINWVSSRITVGTAAEGDKAYVTYTKKVGDGTAETIKNELIVIGAPVAEGQTATTLASLLSGKEIGTAISEFKPVVAEGEAVVTYSDIKINWIAGDGKEIGIVNDVTFDEETLVKDTTGTERDLDGKELTYYIYPVYYTNTSEYSVDLLIKTVLGEDLTEDTLYEIIFVNEYAALDDDATDAERDAVKELAVKYKTEDSLSIADMVKKIVAYYDDIEKKQEALDNAQDDLDKAQSKYDDAKAALEEAQAAQTPDQAKIAELQTAFDKANEALTVAKTNKDNMQAEYDKVGTDREANIDKLLAIVGEGETENLEAKIYKGYKILNYNYLQNLYNEEIKNNLAKEIYYFLTENITVGDKLPEDAVKDAYSQIYEAYESDFYTGYYDSTKKVTNYKQYKGNFDKFLIAKVTEDIKTVSTVKEAKAAITEKAKEGVAPIVELFLAAQKYGKVLTDKEYEEFKDELEDYYYYYVLYYKNFSIEGMLGKTNITAAAQFNKLMDWFLEYEEVKAEAVDKNGYLQITYKYTNSLIGGYEFGDPASEAESETGAE